MTHSNLTRWIEDADARNALLESGMISHFQENTAQHHVHLLPAIKMVSAWWHHNITSHLVFHGHGPLSASHR